MTDITAQEQFWLGEFGDEYVERNSSPNLVPSNLYFFSKIFSRTSNVDSVLEIGANIGLNLEAIKILRPHIELSAVEINKKAATILRSKQNVAIYNQSILDDLTIPGSDLVLTKGLLIHINPGFLDKVYGNLYKSALKYICIAEYYSPMPVEVPYRGHRDCLFKRDFAGELLDKYSDLKLVDYGFIYHRDHNFPADDFTWFLLEKAVAST
jgi:pseudaminic acid biosynthesis-associated methylase